MATAAVVTGARGIALETAKCLLREGIVTDVILLSRDLDGRAAHAMERELRVGGGKMVHMPLDLSQPDSEPFAKTCKELESWPVPIRTLVNCAGSTGGQEKLLIATPHASMDLVLNVNLIGPMQLTKSVLKQMLRNKLANRSICNVSSIVAQRGNAGQTVYAASKAGLNGFTLSLAKEVGSRGIRVNAVQPGFVKTEMTAHLNETEALRMLGGSMLNRFASTEEIANVITFLSSDKASFVTGQVWNVDGGM